MKYVKVKTPQGELLYSPEEKHLYSRHDTSKSIGVWTCYQKTICKRKNSTELKCFARFRVHTNEKGVREFGEHSDHPNHEQIYADIIRRNNMNNDIDTLLAKCPENIHQINTRYIFNRNKATGIVKSNLKYRKMASQFYRRKHKNRPKLPKQCEEIKKSFEDANILEKYGLTLDEKSQLYLGTFVSPDHSFCVFKSQYVIDLIQSKISPNHRRYLLDGTFKTAAKPFKQLLTISVEYEHKIHPVFYILSTSKSVSCYTNIFKYVERTLQLKPKRFMCDFEASLRKALGIMYPKAIINGCWFHFRKCILKRIKLYGISKLWNQNARKTNPELSSKAKTIYRMVGVLPLLPAKDFSSGYLYVRKKVAEFKLCTLFAKFFAYFERTWVLENKKRALSVASLDMRTTSSVESMHRVFGKQFPHHSNIYNFIENLRQFEFTVKDKLEEIVDGDGPLPRNFSSEKDRLRDEKIKRLSKLLKEHKITVHQFLDEMSNEDENGNDSEDEWATDSDYETDDSADDAAESSDDEFI